MVRNLARETLAGILVVFGLMAYGVARYPASLSQGGLLSLMASSGALLAYGGVTVSAARASSGRLETALRQGAVAGLFLGVAAAIGLGLELFAPLGSTWGAVAGVSQWGLMFLTFGAAGSAGFFKARSLPLAVAAAGWAAVISTTLTLLCGYGIGLLAMPHMQQVLFGEFLQSGLADPQAYVIYNTLSSGTMTVLLAPVIALAFGLAGALAAALLGSVHGRPARVLASLEGALAASALAALVFANTLERAARPPYILFGLLGLGLSLVCLHPIVRALQRPGSAMGARQ